jgi:hypothetical protein
VVQSTVQRKAIAVKKTNGHSLSFKEGIFHDQVSDRQILKKEFTSW